MENIKPFGVEPMSATLTMAVDISFEKDGKTYEANITVQREEIINMAYIDYTCTIANQEELPELTEDETQNLFEIAEEFAEENVGKI
jgi:hypothetical protein